MTIAVLDASAVIALLKGERGGTKVASLLSDAVVGVFNHAEVVSHFVHLGAPLEEIRAMLESLPITVIPAVKRSAGKQARFELPRGKRGYRSEIVFAWLSRSAWRFRPTPQTRPGRRLRLQPA